MRKRLAHAAVFICVFALFLGYCEWWKTRPEIATRVNAQSPPDSGALSVKGAADATFNGVYLLTTTHERIPCYMKEAPRRFLWRSATRWHLSTEPVTPGDGYATEGDDPASSEWIVDGADEPAPVVSHVAEGLEGLEFAAETVPPETLQ